LDIYTHLSTLLFEYSIQINHSSVYTYNIYYNNDKHTAII